MTPLYHSRAASLVLTLVLAARMGDALPDGQKAAAYAEAVKSAEAQNERTREPYGEQNLKDAAKFMSTRIRDSNHGGDATKFFESLDSDSNKGISIGELQAVQDNMSELNNKQSGGVWNMMHNLLETKSQRGGFHAELFAHLDADGDGTVSHEEFHNEL